MANIKTSKRALIAKIHIGKKELGFDDDTYRDVLWRVTGKRSCSDMSIAELKAVIADMQKAGFKVKPAKKHGKKPDVTAHKKELIRKIEAMLADMSLPWAYADGMAQNMFKVAKVQWLGEDKLRRLMQALAVYQRRQKRAEQAQKRKKDRSP